MLTAHAQTHSVAQHGRDTAARTVLGLEQVEGWQDLAVVRHERLADHFARRDQLLHDLEHLAHHLGVLGVERGCTQNKRSRALDRCEKAAVRTLDGDDQLRNDRKDLLAALCKQIVRALEEATARSDPSCR